MSEKPLDLIVVGDSTIDTFIKIHDASVECDLNHEECKICIGYGEKIPVDSMSRSIAGNAANVSIGSSKLGLETAVYTHVGSDGDGELIKKTMLDNKVLGDYIKMEPGKTSNLSVVLTFQGERTIFVYHQPWFYHLPELKKAKWLYFTSLSESFTDSNIVDEVAHYIDKSQAKLVFGPGTFQIRSNIKRYPRTLERCELLICNLEEAKKILELDSGEKVNIHDVLSKMLLLGPKKIVITDGEEGSYATDGNKMYKAGVFPTRLVEKTGAGDAYSAAFIAALNFGHTIDEAMIWGTINSSSVIKQMGPQTGQMTRDEIERYRKTVPEMVAAAF